MNDEITSEDTPNGSDEEYVEGWIKACRLDEIASEIKELEDAKAETVNEVMVRRQEIERLQAEKRAIDNWILHIPSEPLSERPDLQPANEYNSARASKDNPLFRKLEAILRELGVDADNLAVFKKLKEMAENGDPIIQEVTEDKELLWKWPGCGERERPVKWSSMRTYLSKIRKKIHEESRNEEETQEAER